MKYSVKEIRKNITTNQARCERAILAIYAAQTAEEKQAGKTCLNDGVGFNGPDGGKMSYYAQWLLSGKHLSGSHLKDAFARIGKYAGQLAIVAASREVQGKPPEESGPEEPAIKEHYVETHEGWVYHIVDERTGREISNSLNVPPFTQKEDAEASAFQWQIQNGLV